MNACAAENAWNSCPRSMPRRKPTWCSHESLSGSMRLRITRRPSCVSSERALPRPDGAAEIVGADLFGGLVHVHSVRLAEQREQGVRILARRRRRGVQGRELAGEDRGYRAQGVLGDGRVVSVPRRSIRERGEVRKQVGVDVAVAVEQGNLRELVEDDHHDPRRPGDRHGQRMRSAVAEEDTGRARRDEQHREDEGRDGQEAQPLPHDGNAQTSRIASTAAPAATTRYSAAGSGVETLTKFATTAPSSRPQITAWMRPRALGHTAPAMAANPHTTMAGTNSTTSAKTMKSRVVKR